MVVREEAVRCDQLTSLLLENTDTCDVSLILGDDTKIMAHKCILASGSPVFKVPNFTLGGNGGVYG